MEIFSPLTSLVMSARLFFLISVVGIWKITNWLKLVGRGALSINLLLIHEN
jgi:hypothetical protein